MGISKEQALDCFGSDDLVGLGMEADVVRRRLHPEGVVGYVREAALKVSAGEIEFDAPEAVDGGATAIALAGIRNSMDECETAIRGLKQRFPAVWLSGLHASEVWAMAGGSPERVREVLARLRDAGLDSLSAAPIGEGCGVEEWAAVHRAAHGLGMPTAAAFVFGDGTTAEQTVERLEAVRQLQSETGGFAALIPVRFRRPQRDLDEATAVESLKTLAIARMMLEEIPHVQVDRVTHSLKVLQMALRFGGDDAGPVPESVGAEEELRRIIRDAGFRPAQRDAAYRTVFLN